MEDSHVPVAGLLGLPIQKRKGGEDDRHIMGQVRHGGGGDFWRRKRGG